MKCFNCEYFGWIERVHTNDVKDEIICHCMKAERNICKFARTEDYFINHYNIEGVNAPDWCPYYNTPDHEDGENGWETLRETNMMEWNP